MNPVFKSAFKPRPFYLSAAPLVLWQSLPRPLDWTDIFGRSGPVEVEIGFGNGERLVRRAAERPDLNLVGLELAWDSVKRAMRRINQAGLTNVRLLLTDAHMALDRLFAPRSISLVTSLFPAPWPKERHVQRRLFNPDFLKLLNSRLTDDARGLIVTDFEPFLEWTLGSFPDTGLEADWKPIPPQCETKYERKWQAGGQETFFEISFVKTRHLDIPATEDAALQTYRLNDFNPEKFAPQNQQGELTIKFREFLFDPKKEKGLALVLTAEKNMVQDVWIKIAREEGVWRIGLAAGGNTFPTQAVKQAVELTFQAAARTVEPD
ncbi:MAG: hypothetical protein V1816_06780 [Pseudomonadota bacterium]